MIGIEFYIGLFIFSLMVLMPVLDDWRKGKLDFLSPRNIFVAFFFLYYGLRTLDLYGSEVPLSFYDFGSGETKQAELTEVLYMSILGLTCFYFGYYGRVVVALEGFLPKFRDLPWSERRTGDVILLFLIAGAGASLYLFHLGGGFFYYLENINYVRLFVLTDVGYLKFLVNLLSIAVLLAGIQVYRTRKGGWFLFALAALSVFLNLIVAHRWAAMQTIMYLLVIWNCWQRRISAALMVTIVVALVIFNVSYGSYRSYTEEAESRILETGLESVVRLDEESQGYMNLFLSNIWNHFHGTDSLLYTRSLMKSEGASHHYGWYILQDILLVSVPRSLWPDKPNPSHVQFNNLMRAENPNYYNPEEKAGGVVQTILGELYWAGGLAGIAAGMYLVGLLCGVLYLYMLNHRNNPYIMILYATGIVHIVMLNGSLSVTFAKWLYMMVVIATVEFYMAMSAPRGAVIHENA
ncbi:MAG: hypothetical protein CVU61_15720 [Deltaproteobacteria bacterium HGW-Deltaproteobacteria-19]|jgi:oligosaccharide repeat unit polymerase|nr:MAG: hypothetical protein CVU61_15720 [Deltaproteobacteria bacterium HGW-Deltaproteobacteria-19]